MIILQFRNESDRKKLITTVRQMSFADEGETGNIETLGSRTKEHGKIVFLNTTFFSDISSTCFFSTNFSKLAITKLIVQTF